MVRPWRSRIGCFHLAEDGNCSFMVEVVEKANYGERLYQATKGIKSCFCTVERSKVRYGSSVGMAHFSGQMPVQWLLITV